MNFISGGDKIQVSSLPASLHYVLPPPGQSVSVCYLTLNFFHFSFLSLVLSVENSTMHQFSIYLLFLLHQDLVAAHEVFLVTYRIFHFGAGTPELVGSLVVARRLTCPTACGTLVL